MTATVDQRRCFLRSLSRFRATSSARTVGCTGAGAGVAVAVGGGAGGAVAEAEPAPASIAGAGAAALSLCMRLTKNQMMPPATSSAASSANIGDAFEAGVSTAVPPTGETELRRY